MRIVNLIENTAGKVGCITEHGLSFYIETARHRILSDFGPSDRMLENAKKLGIELSCVDTAVLSHGHYDHSGGLLSFARINDHAKIYMQKTAFGEYCAEHEDGLRYIGIDRRIRDLTQVEMLEGDLRIDEELSVFRVDQRKYDLPASNKRIREMKNGVSIQDHFQHEHFLVIQENGIRVLISGCAHSGILNIMDTFERKYGGSLNAVISGFHMMKKTEYTQPEIDEIRSIASVLNDYKTAFYTCHCTGIPAYEEMKGIMGDKLKYIHTGEELIINGYT